ncbi:MAG TPA: hypothetical protein VHF08_02885, partial [Nitrososphaeraceae archaeon]|nr:hypothetical protein [Nitrososphaeraceae archaeon]
KRFSNSNIYFIFELYGTSCGEFRLKDVFFEHVSSFSSSSPLLLLDNNEKVLYGSFLFRDIPRSISNSQ